MTDHIRTRNEQIYRTYQDLRKTIKRNAAIEKLSDYIWEVGDKAECLSTSAINKIVSQMKDLAQK